MSVLLTEGVGGMGDGVGGGKNHWLGHIMSSHDTHTMAHATPVAHRGNESKPKSPPPYSHSPVVTTVYVVTKAYKI